MADTAGPEVKPGESTSEHVMASATNWWSKVVIIAGALMTTLPPIIAALQPVAETKTGIIVLQILGGLMTVAGIITKGITSASYSSGRSLVKAAAARDVPPPPAV